MDGNDQQALSVGWRLLGLGDSSWYHNGSSVKFPTRLCQALAWYLVLHGRDVRRADIVEEFWPDAKPEDGQNQLRVTLSRLKSMLSAFPDAPKLTTDRFNVSIDIGSIPCIALNYGALLDRVEASSGSEKRTASIELVRLYGGDLLPEFDYPFFGQIRSRYQERNVHYLGCVSKDLKRTGDFVTAVDILQRALSIDPMQEELYVMLFGIYAQMDRPLLIEKTVLNLIREMEARIGDRPTARLEKTIMLALPPRLRDRMTEVLSTPLKTAESVDKPPVGPYENTYIPRYSEYSDLHGHVTSGLSRCIAVSGPPGSGKTRMVYEYWLQHQHDGRMTWLDGSKVGSVDELLAQLTACASRLSDPEDKTCLRGTILFDSFLLTNPQWSTTVVDFLNAHGDVTIIVTTRSADIPVGWAFVPVATLIAPLSSMSDEACLKTQAVQMLFSLMPAAVTSLSETTSTIAYLRTLFTYIDPLPFMIEVVASWLSAMTIQQLIVRLSKDRSNLLQAAAERSRDGVVFSDTIRASVKVLSHDGKEVLRLLALYGEPLSKEKIIDVLALRTDVAVKEICDSGLVRLLEDGKIVVWSLVGEFVRSTQPTSCRTVLRKMIRMGVISITTATSSSTEIVETSLSFDNPNDLNKLLQQIVFTGNTSDIYATKQILHALSPKVLMLDFSSMSQYEVTVILAIYGLVRNSDFQMKFVETLNQVTGKHSHLIKVQREQFKAMNGLDIDVAPVLAALESDFTSYVIPTITTLLYLNHRRPNAQFTALANAIIAGPIDQLDKFQNAGVILVRAMLREDTNDLLGARSDFRTALNSLRTLRIFIHASYCLYQLMRTRTFKTFEDLLPELVQYESVNEPGIVCGIASQLAFSFTDKRPETSLHYLRISNSLYSAHLSNEKTSFATMNRRIELILRDSLGDDYIDTHLTSVDVSNVSIGDLCGPLDEYVRQTTLFAQG
jgi:DNA-binding SARP family transcriptional activator